VGVRELDIMSFRLFPRRRNFQSCREQPQAVLPTLGWDMRVLAAILPDAVEKWSSRRQICSQLKLEWEVAGSGAPPWLSGMPTKTAFAL
jgi:hypothetical protein